MSRTQRLGPERGWTEGTEIRTHGKGKSVLEEKRKRGWKNTVERQVIKENISSYSFFLS